MSQETMSKICTQSTGLTNQVNECLAHAEAELRDANIQLTFWWETSEAREYVNENEEDVIDSWMIGLLDGSALMAKLVRYYPNIDKTIDVGSPIFLQQAPFGVRLHAAQHLDVFLEELASELTRAVNRLAAVKDAVPVSGNS